MKKRTFDDFDEFALGYRDIHTKNIKLSGVDSAYFAEFKVILLTKYEENIHLKVLDVGCGDGLSEFFFKKHFSNWEMTGIDVSQKSIDEATGKKLNNADFRIYDGINIPFPDQFFDVVFIAGVLHHVSYSLHNDLLQQIQRVLKSNGRLHLFEHNPLNPFTRYLVNTCIFDKDAKLLSSNYTRKLIAKNGFEKTKRKFVIFFPRKGFFLKLIFLEKYLQRFPFGGQYYFMAVKA